MRPEMTPSVSRMVAARRQELGYPLRLFNITNFFRYERPQKGRLREFWQLNADIFGVEGIEADAEMIQLTDSILKAYGATEDMYEIRINSRTEMDEFLNKSGLQDKKQFMRLIDKKSKMDPDKFKAALNEIDASGLLSGLEGMKKPDKIESLLEELNAGGVTNIVYDPTLARGFDYYTDIVFEVFDKNPENNRSLFGGGRYDGLVGEFGVEPVPTVGFGMGDVTLENFLKSNNLIPDTVSEPSTDLVLTGVGIDADKLNNIASSLRKSDVNVAVDYTGRKIEKKIKAVEKLGVENVLFAGEEEIEVGKYTLKNIKTGEERKLTIDEIAGVFREKNT